MENDGNKPDNLRSQSPALQDLQRDATALAHRVVKKRVSLSEISIEVAGLPLLFLMREVRSQIAVAFGKFETACHVYGHENLIPLMSSYLSKLFGINEELLMSSSLPELTPEEERKRTVNYWEEKRTLSGQMLTVERMDRELLLLGNVYLEKPNGDFLDKAKLRIETVFIQQCQNVQQQRKILNIVAALTVHDLVYVQSQGTLLLFNLRQEVFHKLSLAVLDEEDKQSSRSGKIRAVCAPSGEVPIVQPSLQPAAESKPKRSLSEEQIQAINLDWEEIDWFGKD